MAANPFALRWAVNVEQWEPEEMEWRFLLGLIPQDERDAVLKFKFSADQKRALVSRLMQRRAVQTAVGIPWDEIQIKRTKGKKPFLANEINLPEAPNFNYNVSHEGHFVVLASEPHTVCGVDCAAPSQLRRGKPQTMEDIYNTFKRNFTDLEWKAIWEAGESEEEQQDCFRCHWSLKEAFTKARGDGIAFDLSRCEFQMEGPWVAERARVNVDSVPQPHWIFSLHKLTEGHWVSVARGPPTDVIDANGEFYNTFKKPRVPHRELVVHLAAPSPSFSLLCVSDLLPPNRIQEYEIAGGDVI